MLYLFLQKPVQDLGQIRDDIVKVNGKLPENVSVAEDKNNDKDNHGA